MPDNAQHLLAQPFGSLPALIACHALQRPHHTALVLGEQTLDYATLHRGLEKVAQALQQHGLQPGDVMAVCAGTSVAYLLAFLGALRAGNAGSSWVHTGVSRP